MLKQAPILVVGHPSHDILFNPNNQVTKCLGGSAPYVSNVLMGAGIKHEVISYVGDDFKYFNECPFRPILLKKSRTTTFINFNTCVPRKQKILNFCDYILPQDIKYNTDIAIVCGIFNEVLPSTIQTIRSKTRILVGDIQGFIRKKERKTDYIGMLYISDTVYSESIFLFDFIKVSVEELEYVDIKILVDSGVTVLLTLAEKGCYLYRKGSSMYIPALPAKLVDETGAGDSFLAGFIIGLYLKYSIEQAVDLGHKCAAISIQYLGIPCSGHFKNFFNALNIKK